MLEFVVEGDPVPQGSMSAIPFHKPCTKCRPGKPCGRQRMCIEGRELGANITHGNKEKLDVWRATIALQAKMACNRASLMVRPVYPTGGVIVGCVFFKKRPQGHVTTKGVLSSEGLRKPCPTTKPDCDKMLRGCLDALTEAQVWTDDSQAIAAPPFKTWAPIAAREGHSVIIVEPAIPSDLDALAKVYVRMVAVVTASRPPPTQELFA